MVPVVTPRASGASVPCQSPCPHAGEDGQKNRSPGRTPVPYNAAAISTTIARCVWRTAAGSSRVVPEVYWNTASSSGVLCASYSTGYLASEASSASSATTTPTSAPARAAPVHAFVGDVQRLPASVEQLPQRGARAMTVRVRVGRVVREPGHGLRASIRGFSRSPKASRALDERRRSGALSGVFLRATT